MNTNTNGQSEIKNKKQKVIARFGGAALIRGQNGIWQLQGGSKDDKVSAQEWASLFQHEAVFQFN